MEGLTAYQRGALEVVMQRPSSNPVTGKDIANAIGLKPRKSGKEGADLRSVINALRVKGYPVCANGRGYWWPRSQEELSAYILSFDMRINDQIRARDGLKKGFDKLGPVHGAEAVAKVTRVLYRVGDKVFEVLQAHEEAFLRKYQGAERIK